MPHTILLLGAGSSRNWGGLLASQVSSDLMARLQGDAQLTRMLNRTNFEDTLTQVQGNYLHSRTPENEERLKLLQDALSSMFDRMNKYFQSRTFEFSSDVSKSFQKFLVRFDAIFSLNQDLLLEIHYRNENAALWYELAGRDGRCRACGHCLCLIPLIELRQNGVPKSHSNRMPTCSLTISCTSRRGGGHGRTEVARNRERQNRHDSATPDPPLDVPTLRGISGMFPSAYHGDWLWVR
jgi:hypothetical protein